MVFKNLKVTQLLPWQECELLRGRHGEKPEPEKNRESNEQDEGKYQIP